MKEYIRQPHKFLNEPQTTYLLFAPESRQCIFRGTKEDTYAYLQDGVQDGEYRVFGGNSVQDVKKARGRLESLGERLRLSDIYGKELLTGTKTEIQIFVRKLKDGYFTLEGRAQKMSISTRNGRVSPDDWEFIFSWCCEEEEEQKETAPYLQEGAVICE